MKPSIASLFLGCLSYVSAQDIVEVAVENGNFKTLVAAVDALGIVDTVKFTDPLTVFAPTDDAFNALPVGLVDYLLEPEQKDALESLIWYHILRVDPAVNAETAISLAGQSVETQNRESIDIALDGSNLFINDAQVIIPDVTADNGIIHAIDKVLVPPSFLPVLVDLYDTAASAGMFTTLLAAVDAAGLTDTVLKTPGPYTVLAPTDEAFAKLPAGTVEGLLGDIPALTSILAYHVIEGRVMAETVLTLDSAKTLNGASVEFSGHPIVINDDAVVTTMDVMASNGVIHIVDTVLIPPAAGMNNVNDSDMERAGTVAASKTGGSRRSLRHAA